jgi:peptidyl-dipeptidase A
VPPPAAAATGPDFLTTAPPPAGPPTVDEARRFFGDVDKDLHRLWVARDRAAWVSENFITDDTEQLAADGEEATAAYVARAIHASRRFDGLELPPELARQMLLLRLAQTIPAPSDPAKRRELAGIESWMTGAYGKGQYCPAAGTRLTKAAPAPGDKSPKCVHLDELESTIETSRNWDELTEAWKSWHAVGAPMREKFAEYVALANEGAKEIGYADVGAMWRSGYDMPAADFEADIERLWQDVRPLYEQLHCYVRARLRDKYGKDKVPAHAPIPAHLLGNMWAQEWEDVYDLVQPFRNEPSLDVTRKLKEKKYDAVKMVKLGESFFTSLGFDPLPKSFWERSLFVRPRDRDVVCHASAWDVAWDDDLRIKMCIEPTETDLITIHHELGHDFYYSRYYQLPTLFQQGANDGFHEGIGDTLALSVTPAYLKTLGLLDQVPTSEHAKLNTLMKTALDKVAFLPFGLMIDKWRWDVFSGRIPKDKYNEGWWALRAAYQGVSPPLPRSEADFDPGAKFHVPASTPYIRYFLARIYQFQFHRALCKAAGYTGPLDECSIYGNKAAGSKLIAMLSLGASKPWPEALAVLGGETKADAGAMLEYFAPLAKWLAEANKGETCGW